MCYFVLVSTVQLQAVSGKQSREKGGFGYKSSYILDAVLMSDRIKCLDDMSDVLEEHLGWETKHFLLPIFVLSIHLNFDTVRNMKTRAFHNTSHLRSLGMLVSPELRAHIMQQVT